VERAMAVDFTGVSNSDLQCASHSAAVDLTGSALVVRRRHERWPDAERARITAESFALGEPIAQVARRSRRNWRFVGSTKGGDASALLYSLVETCCLNGVEPDC